MNKMTAREALLTNDQEAAAKLLRDIKEVAVKNPKEHARLLGYPYNPGDFEEDRTNGIRRIMVELKILSIFGKHCCPEILLNHKR